MITDSDIANEAGRMLSMAKRLAKHVSCEEKLSFLWPVIGKCTYLKSKCGLSSNFGRAVAKAHYVIGHISSLTELDLEDGIKVFTSVEKTIDDPISFTGETPLFHCRLHELSFACAAFRMELSELLEEERAAAKVKPTQQPEPATSKSGFVAPTFCHSSEPTQPPEPTQQPAEPTQQPEPTTVVVFVDQSSRLFEEEWVAAKAARQHALVASTAASIKDATNDLLIAIAQLGRAK